MSNTVLKAGSAAVKIDLDPSCFPNAEFCGLHDELFVRALVLESERRFVLVSIDTPSLFPAELEKIRKMIMESCNADGEYIWITVNHSFSAPHIWPAADNPESKRPLPPVFLKDPELIKIAKQINEKYRAACQMAAVQALDNIEEAYIGFGKGQCAINVNRNMLTKDGWWQGTDQTGFADRVLSVIRIENNSGCPLAILYNYSVQSSVTAGSVLPDGGKLISADLPGAASRYIEREYGHGCTAIFLPAATGDQAPLYRINYCDTDSHGRLREASLGEKGYVLLEEQGRMLGAETVKISEKINVLSESESFIIKALSRKYTCKGQKREAGQKYDRPLKECRFIEDGDRELTAGAVLIGDIALAGLQGEMDGITVSGIRNRSPFDKTIVATFINGCAKTMPQRNAYLQLQYTAVNSPFAAGSAEKSADTVIQLLNELN